MAPAFTTLLLPSIDPSRLPASNMVKTSISPLASGLFVFANLLYSAGSFIADFNETHVLNPRWPPHAKFHNGQTMTLGVLLTMLSLYLVFRPAATIQQKQDNIWLAAIIGSFYCAAALAAILYPGTAWADPEFEVSVQGWQGYLFAFIITTIWTAYALGTSTLSKAKSS